MHQLEMIFDFGSYLSQILMDFAPIWLIFKPVIIRIILLTVTAYRFKCRHTPVKSAAMKDGKSMWHTGTFKSKYTSPTSFELSIRAVIRR